MTTVVAVQHDTEVVFAWDHRVSYGNAYETLKQPKVFSTSGIVFGVAGSLRYLNLLYTTAFPEYDGSDAFSWVVTHVVPVLKQIGVDNDMLDEDGDVPAALLVAVDGEVFNVAPGYSVASTESRYYAVGSGSQFALGALHAGADPAEAIKIAASCDAGTGAESKTAKDWELIE